MGISKKELLEDYYYDEFILLMEQYNAMHEVKPSEKDREVEEVYADQFF
jgi:hypothetical protein